MINWSAIDRSSLVGRLVRLPARALPAQTLMRVRRGPARGMKWIAGSSVHGCWLGTYELEKQRALERFVRPGMTVYDIGAQAGYYTLFFSRLVGESGRVYSFEPCPYEAHFLIDHMRINRLANVRVILAAVSERAELLPMSFDRGTCQNRLCLDSALAVPAISLDSAGLPPPNLIKIDVEGAESAVLSGAPRILRKARPKVFVALHGPEQRTACVELLREAGYSIHDFKGEPVNEASSVDEIYALAPTLNP